MASNKKPFVIKHGLEIASGQPVVMSSSTLTISAVSGSPVFHPYTNEYGLSGTLVGSVSGLIHPSTIAPDLSGHFSGTFEGSSILGPDTTATTADPSDSSTKIATTAYVNEAIGGTGQLTQAMENRWNSTYYTVKDAGSADWNSVYTNVNTYSALWEANRLDLTEVANTSANWNTAYNKSVANEADITNIANLSSAWDSTSVSVNANSAGWGGADSVYNTVKSNSGNWEASYNQLTDSTTDINIDSSLLFVDKSGDKVGIGTNVPQEKFTVAGNISAQGVLYANEAGNGNSSQWFSVYTTTKDNSAAWALNTADVTNLANASADWDSVYTSVTDTSGQWNTAYTHSQQSHAPSNADNTAANQTSHADVVVDGDFTSDGLMKSDGSGTYSIVTDNSTGWDTTKSTVDTGKDSWDSVYTDVNDNSGDWSSAYTSVNLQSGEWDSAWNTLTATSADWDTAYSHSQGSVTDHTDVSDAGSGEIITADERTHFTSTYTSVHSTSADWDSTHTTVNTYSGGWESVGSSATTVATNSSYWQTSYTTVNESSGDWASTAQGGGWTDGDGFIYASGITDSVSIGQNIEGEGKLTVIGDISATDNIKVRDSGNSDQWSSVYTSVQLQSGEWDSTWNTLTATSGKWAANELEIAGLENHITQVANASGGWDTTKTTVDAGATGWDATKATVDTQENEWDSTWNTLTANSGLWDATYNTVHEISGQWSTTYADVTTQIDEWNSTWNTLTATSGEWDIAYEKIITQQHEWDSTWNTLTAASAQWETAYTDSQLNKTDITNIATASGSWDSTNTDVNANSAVWDSTNTDVNANSAEWVAAYTDLNANSADWSSARTDLNANSASWDSTNTDVNANSAEWVSSYTDVNANSADWSNVYTQVNDNSASWDQSAGAYTTVNEGSASWYSTNTDVNSNSANWSATYTSVHGTSGLWDATYSTVNTSSGGWQAWEITDGGNAKRSDKIGINISTTEPQAYLDVNGSMKVAGDVDISVGSFTVHSSALVEYLKSGTLRVADNNIQINWDGNSGNLPGAGFTVVQGSADVAHVKLTSSADGWEFKTPDYGGADGKTLTFDIDADKTIEVDGDLRIEADSRINQDLTSDADVTFGSITIGTSLDTDWSSTYTSVHGTSATWDSVATDVNETSALWDATYTSIHSTSAVWNSTNTDVNANSAKWESVYTKINAKSALWDATYASVHGTSATWDSVVTDVNETSGLWDATYTTVHSTSATWDSVVTDVNETSALWDATYTTVHDTSAQWASTYADVLTQIGEWDSTWNTLTANSGNWNVAYDQLTDSSTDINIDSGTLYVDKSEDAVGIGTTSPDYILEIIDTGAVRFPVGTTAQQPGNATGLFRFNTTTSLFEGNDGTGWTGIGGVVDSDQDTKIVADASDSDTIHFYVGVSNTAVEQITLADGVLKPVTDNDVDLGTSTLEFKDLYLDGTANIDSLVADTADINAGNIDNTIIGATTPVAGDFSAVTILGDLSARDRITTNHATVSGNLFVKGSGIFPSLLATGGTIDSTTIGGSTPAAGTFTSIVGTSLSLTDGNITNVGQISLDTIAADGNDIDISLSDNRDAAFEIVQGSVVYFRARTANDTEQVEIPNNSGTPISIKFFDNPVIGNDFRIGGGTIDGVTEATIDNVRIDGTNIGHTSAPDLLQLQTEYLTVSGGLSARGPVTVGDTTIGANISGAVSVEGNVHIKSGSNLKIGGSNNGYLLMGDNSAYTPGPVVGAITLAWLNGEIKTSLANSSVTMGTHTTGKYVSNLGTGTGITIGNNTGTNSIQPTIAVDYGSTASTAVQGNTTITINGTTDEIEVTGTAGQALGGAPSYTIGLPDDVVIAGNLTVGGTTSTVNTANLLVEDPLIQLAKGNNTSDAVDIGFYGLYDTSGSTDLYTGLFRDANDNGKWKLFKDNQAVPTTTISTSGTGYAVATLVAHLEDSSTTITGGNIDGTTIGGSTPAVGTFTNLTVNDDFSVYARAQIFGDTASEVTLNVKGATSQSTDIFNVELVDGTNKLTVSDAGVTTAASLVATTADINGGSIDGAAIGAASQSTGKFTGVNITGATATRLLATNGTKDVISTDINSWISGTSDQITVTDDSDGTITLSTPQDIHTGADVLFNTLAVNGNLSAHGGIIGTPHTPDASITFSVSSTDAIKIPVGSCDQRPTGLSHSGYIRYNSEFGIFEGYEGAYWTGLGGVIDVDRDTRVLAEIAPNQDDDTLFFHTGGTNRISMSAGVIKPHADNNIDIGTADNQLKDIYVHGIGYIDQLGTDGDPVAAYISSGEVDGAVIGGETRAAGYFTDIQTEQYIKHVGDTDTNIEFDTNALKVNVGGVEQITTTTTETVINDGSADSNFRVESDDDTSALFVSGANTAVGIGTQLPGAALHINTTDAVKLPAGTDAQQPGQTDQLTALVGMVRYNTTNNAFEGYSNAGWGSLGSVIDIDRDTKIEAESSSDEDKLRFYTGGSQQMIITDGGLVGIGTATPSHNLDVLGSLSASSVIYTSGGNSIDWDNVYTTTNSYSADWQSVRTTVNEISGETWFHATSAGALGRHVTASHELTAGMAARQNTDGSWVKSVAASLPVNGLDTDVLSAEVLGIVQYSDANIDANPPTGNNFEIIYSGVCNLPGHEFGDPGATLFLSPTTLGKLTTACATGDYHIDKPVGTVLDSNTILVQPFRGMKYKPVTSNEEEWDAVYTTVYANSSSWGGGSSNGIGNTNSVVIDSDSSGSNHPVVDDDYARFTAAGLEGRSVSQVASDIGSSITTVGTIGTGTWQGTAIADTYVANDLTISGGTIDNSVIGGSTPAAGSFTTLKITTPGSAPSSPTSSGTKGQIVYDDNYVYICTATNTWKRAALATW